MSRGRANYNALQSTFKQRFWQGLDFQANYTWSKALTNNLGYYGSAGVAAEGSVRSTTAGPARAILEYARDLDATLIVLGSRGLGALGGLLLGSGAHKILQLASCPVLVVRDKQSLDERHHDVLRAQTRFQA